MFYISGFFILNIFWNFVRELLSSHRSRIYDVKAFRMDGDDIIFLFVVVVFVVRLLWIEQGGAFADLLMRKGRILARMRWVLLAEH